MTHLSRQLLEAGLTEIKRAPADRGRVALLVRRPAVGEREVIDEAFLDPGVGLVGDSWSLRPSSRTRDRSPHPDMQVTAINTRLVALVAGPLASPGAPDRRPLAGDQLYLDLDLSESNLPPGSRLQLGSAVIEVTGQPHTGCAKWAAHFGLDALRFVNSSEGQSLRLRGLNARVVVAGTVRFGDLVTKWTPHAAPDW
jgi:hypothetical protein